MLFISLLRRTFLLPRSHSSRRSTFLLLISVKFIIELIFLNMQFEKVLLALSLAIAIAWVALRE